MRWFMPVGVIVALSGNALSAGQPPATSFSLLGSILQMIAALAVVVGLILLFYYVSNRVLKSGAMAGGSPRYIRMIETRFLAPKKALFLVEVGGEYLLLASSGEGLQFIKQVDMLEEIEIIDGQGIGKLVPDALQNKIIDLVARLPKRNGAGAGDVRAHAGGLS